VNIVSRSVRTRGQLENNIEVLLFLLLPVDAPVSFPGLLGSVLNLTGLPTLEDEESRFKRAKLRSLPRRMPAPSLDSYTVNI
jgi:hypothetical protein